MTKLFSTNKRLYDELKSEQVIEKESNFKNLKRKFVLTRIARISKKVHDRCA